MSKTRDFAGRLERDIRAGLSGEQALAVELLRLEAIYAFLAEWRLRRFSTAAEMLRCGEDAVPFLGFNPCSPCRGAYLPYLPTFWQANLAARAALSLLEALPPPDRSRLRMLYVKPLQQLSEGLYRFMMAEARGQGPERDRAWRRAVAILAAAGFHDRGHRAGELRLAHVLNRAQQLATQALAAWQEVGVPGRSATMVRRTRSERDM